MSEYVYDGQIDRDGWGPCCVQCGSRGQAYKPCDVCIKLAQGEDRPKTGPNEDTQNTPPR